MRRFKQNPFQDCVAEDEYKSIKKYTSQNIGNDDYNIEDIDSKVYLPVYFVPPPDFDALFSLQHTIVYGEPGSGKSACRCMLDYHCAPGSDRQLEDVVSVTHSDFRKIHRRMMEGINSDAHIHVNTVARNTLLSLVERVYQGVPKGHDYEKEFIDLRNFLHCLKQYLFHLYSGSISPKKQMEELARLIKKAGFKALFILIDDIEQGVEENQREVFQRLLAPLIARDKNSLSRIGGIYYKLFLPLELKEMLQDQKEFDIIDYIELRWSHDSLLRVLEKRLSKMPQTGSPINSLASISELSLRDKIDERVVQYSENPRDLILLGRKLRPERLRPLTEDDLQKALMESSRSSRYTKTSQTFLETKFLPTFGAVLDQDNSVKGSGFVVNIGGGHLFVTCAHVIKKVFTHDEKSGQESKKQTFSPESVIGNKVWIQLADSSGERVHCPVRYYYPDPEEDDSKKWTARQDIALLTINPNTEDLFSEFLSLNREKKINLKNSEFFCYGYPETAGKRGDWLDIERVGEKIGHGFRKAYQPMKAESKIGKGVSGAPLFDKSGELIGMIQSVNYGDSRDFVYYIPSDTIYAVLASVLERGK